MDGGLVDKEPMVLFIVLPQALSMVPDDDNEGVLDRRWYKKPPEPVKLRIDEGDLSEVRIGGVLLVEGRRRFIGRVGVVEVDPGEELLVLVILEPGKGLIEDLVRRPLHRTEGDLFEFAQVEVVEIDVEALVKAPLGIKDVSGDERRGRVPLVLEERGHRLDLTGHDEAAVVPDPVEGGKGPRHDRGVGRERERRRCEALLEFDPERREPVDGRGFDVVEPVAAEPVGSHGVEGDQDDIEVFAPAQPREIRFSGIRKTSAATVPIMTAVAMTKSIFFLMMTINIIVKLAGFRDEFMSLTKIHHK